MEVVEIEHEGQVPCSSSARLSIKCLPWIIYSLILHIQSVADEPDCKADRVARMPSGPLSKVQLPVSLLARFPK